jgi:hypothetical protein
MVIYNLIQGSLMLIEEKISTLDKPKIELVHQVAAGKQEAAAEGTEVFLYLKNAVLKGKV